MQDQFMQEAINLAREMMLNRRGGPFGAVIVQGNKIIARGYNQVTATNDPTAHAEIVAIRNACAKLNDFNLAGCTMYVNCEPCPMCLAALYWAKIDMIYFGATRHDAAEIGFDDELIYQEINNSPEKRRLKMVQIMRQEAIPVFQLWQDMEDKILY